MRYLPVMKKICKKVLMHLVMIVVVLHSSLSFVMAETKPFSLNEEERQYINSLGTLKVSADDNFLPLSQQKNGIYHGISVELFETIAESIGLYYEYVFVENASWSNKIDAFKDDSIDILFPVSRTRDREAEGFFTKKYYDAYYCVISDKDNVRTFNKISDLGTSKIGVVQNTAIVEYLKAEGLEQQIEYFQSDEELYKALKLKLVDYGCQNESVFIEDYYHKELFNLKRVFKINDAPKEYCYYFRKNPEFEQLISIFNRGIDAYDSEQLVEKYSIGQMEMLSNYAIQKDRKEFFIGLLFVVAILDIILMKMFLGSRRKADELAYQAKVNQLAFLQAQIKPHFLYNTLSSIAALCYIDAKKAGRLTVILSRYLRNLLDTENYSEYIYLEKEIELIELYLQIEKERHGERLRYHLSCQTEDKSLLILPLIIEPIVENAVKHGVLKKIDGGTVWVNVEKEDVLRVTVEDDGVGMDQIQVKNLYNNANSAGKENIGFANIYNRVKSYGGKIDVFSREQEGTVITLEFPLIKGEQVND